MFNKQGLWFYVSSVACLMHCFTSSCRKIHMTLLLTRDDCIVQANTFIIQLLNVLHCWFAIGLPRSEGHCWWLVRQNTLITYNIGSSLLVPLLQQECVQHPSLEKWRFKCPARGKLPNQGANNWPFRKEEKRVSKSPVRQHGTRWRANTNKIIDFQASSR